MAEREIVKTDCIIPGKRIGPLYLDMDFNEITAIVKQYSIKNLPRYIVIVCDDVRIWIDKETNQCTQILVENNFRGQYDNKIGLGTTLGDISKMGFTWYEDMDAYYLEGIDGMCFELSDIEDETGDWNELGAPIAYITIFHD